MLSSTFLRISLLLLLAACYVVVSQEIEKKVKKKIRMPYIRDDWRPHFNYYPGHKASDHMNRKRAQSTLHPQPVDTSKHLEPYLVRVMHLNKFLCSGIVLNMHEVVTPALCLTKAPPNEIVVKLSDGSEHKGVGTANTSDITMDRASKMLVLLKLEKPLDKLYEKPPPICQHYVRLVDKVEVWNWDISRKFIRKKSVSLIAEDRCKQLLEDSDGMIVSSAVSCLENTKVTKKCEASFGLPYVWRGTICGINLLGHNCHSNTKADVYVRLIKVKSFIARTLQDLKNTKLDDLII